MGYSTVHAAISALTSGVGICMHTQKCCRGHNLAADCVRQGTTRAADVLTIEHKPEVPSERESIEKLG